MDEALRNILLIITVGFGVCIVITMLFVTRSKGSVADKILTTAEDYAAQRKQDFSQARYAPPSLCAHHTESYLKDNQFGKAVEVMEGRKLRPFATGTLYIICSLAIAWWGEQVLVVPPALNLRFAFELIIVFCVVVGSFLYGLYNYSFIFKKVVFYETGFTYQDAILRTVRMPYVQMEHISVGKSWYLGPTQIPADLMRWLWFRYLYYCTLLTVVYTDASSGKPKALQFWALHYQYLEEKAEHFKNNLINQI
jgi:hypothetical protein